MFSAQMVSLSMSDDRRFQALDQGLDELTDRKLGAKMIEAEMLRAAIRKGLFEAVRSRHLARKSR